MAKRYQRGNQNPSIKEEQTTQNEKIQKDKQRFTKQTHKTKDRVTRNPLKPVGELRCSGRVSSSCYTILGIPMGTDRISNIMISVSASKAVGRGFESSSCQAK